jgi:flagellar assembly protein FliH
VSEQRRIPASRSSAYAAWTLPVVAQGEVVKAENARPAEHRAMADAGQAERVSGESLERQLAENIRAGRFAQGVSARDLEAIVLDAAREGRQDGYDEGYARGQQEGFADGRGEGLSAGRKYLEEAAGRFAGLLETLHRPVAGQEQELRAALLEIVVQIARAVVRAELVLQPTLIAHVVEEALAALPLGARNVRVYVGPGDRELLEDFGAGEAVPALLVDPALEPGDCRVESAESLVNFTVSERFDAIVEQFLGTATGPGGVAR